MCSEIKTRLSSIINEKKDQLTTTWKEGIKKFISDIDNNRIKALYDITNFKYIIMNDVNMNLAQASTISMIGVEKVSEYMQFSFGCNNGNYHAPDQSDLFWTKEDLHAKEKGSKTSSHSMIQKDHQVDEDSKVQLGVTHVQESTIELFTAAREGSVKRAEKAILLGADVNAKYIDIHDQNKGDKTPLHFAAQDGHAEVVKLLIQNNAEINAVGKHGNTPLILAAFYGYKDVAKLLLDEGANINDVDKNGYKALYAAAQSRNVEVVELLLQDGADVNYRSYKDETALDLAIFHQKTEVIKLLLQNVDSIFIKDKMGIRSLILSFGKET